MRRRTRMQHPTHSSDLREIERETKKVEHRGDAPGFFSKGGSKQHDLGECNAETDKNATPYTQLRSERDRERDKEGRASRRCTWFFQQGRLQATRPRGMQCGDGQECNTLHTAQI